MRNTTEPRPDRKERTLWSRLPLILGLTSPVWLVVLLVPGSLGKRLLAAGLMLLLAPVALLGFSFTRNFRSLRWLIDGIGFLVALDQRRKEEEKGELDDAKEY